MGKNIEIRGEENLEMAGEKRTEMSLLEIGRQRRQEKMQRVKTRFSSFGAKIKNVFKRIVGAGSTSLDAIFAAPEAAKIAGTEIEAGGKAMGRGVKRGAEATAGAVIESGKAVSRGVKTGVETGAGMVVEGGIATGRGVKKGVEMAGAGLESANKWTNEMGLRADAWVDKKYEAMGDWTQEQWQKIQEKGGDIRQGFTDGIEKARATYKQFQENRAEAARQRKLANLRAEMNQALEAIKWNQERYKEAEQQMKELEGIDDLTEELAEVAE